MTRPYPIGILRGRFDRPGPFSYSTRDREILRTATKSAVACRNLHILDVVPDPSRTYGGNGTTNGLRLSGSDHDRTACGSAIWNFMRNLQHAYDIHLDPRERALAHESTSGNTIAKSIPMSIAALALGTLLTWACRQFTTAWPSDDINTKLLESDV